MPKSRRLGIFGIAKQAARGAFAAAPTYAMGVVGGAIKPVFDIADLPLTGDSAARRGRYKQRARGEGSVRLLVHPDALGLLLYQVTGSQAITGAAAPYSHTFPIIDDIPQANPLTVWSMVGDDWWRFGDAHVGRLSIAGTSGENIVVDCQIISGDASAVAAPAYDLLPTEPRMKFIGSDALMAADSAVPLAVDNVQSCELVIDRALDVRYGTSLTPSLVIPDRNVEFTAGVIMDDTGDNVGWDYFHQAALGTTGLGSVSQDLADGGSFRVRFGRHPDDATRYLEIASAEDNWEYAVDRPESDPAGGPIEFDVAGIVTRPDAGGSEVTITLLNEVAALY